MELASRLLSKTKVNHENGCWDWTAAKSHNGYGILKVGGRSGKAQRAHRISYEIYCGPIPEGMRVCHSCDNSGCINPHHLFLGSQTENVADMDAKGRRYRAPIGETNLTAKLTDADVIAIRAATGMTQQALADQYGVHQTLISLIRRNIVWTHVGLGQRSALV